jgi:hypothetical protein
LKKTPPPPPAPKTKNGGGVSFVDDSASVGHTVASSTYGEDRQKVTRQDILDPYGDKGRYTGVVLRSTGMPHGPGLMEYEEDGRTYEGEWRHGRYVRSCYVTLRCVVSIYYIMGQSSLVEKLMGLSSINWSFGFLSLLTHAFAAPFSISDGTDSEGLLLPTAIDTKASTDSISVTAVVFIAGTMAVPTTASFGKTNATDTATFPGQTVLFTKEISAMECARVTVLTCLATAVVTVVPGKMVDTVALAPVHGRMDVATRVNG